MRVVRDGDRVLFLVRAGERFKWLKWCWHSFALAYREAREKRRSRGAR